MKKIVCLLICLLLVVSLTPAFADGDKAKDLALAAEGTAWRLFEELRHDHERIVLKSVPPEAISYWMWGEKLLIDGLYSGAQHSFETASDSFIKQAVRESWKGGEHIPEYINLQASNNVVEREQSLRELKERIAFASNPEPRIIGADGWETSEWWVRGKVLPAWGSSKFDPSSVVLVTIDSRFLMVYYPTIIVQLNAYGPGAGNGFAHAIAIRGPKLIIHIPDSQGKKVALDTIAVNPDGWEAEKYFIKHLGPIGPGSRVEAFVP